MYGGFTRFCCFLVQVTSLRVEAYASDVGGAKITVNGAAHDPLASFPLHERYPTIFTLVLSATAVPSVTYTLVALRERPVLVSSGGQFNCLSAPRGRANVVCWGSNDQGQLGTYLLNADTRSTITTLQYGDVTSVLSDREAISVSAGYDVLCIVFRGYYGYCRGNNLRCELGISSSSYPNAGASDATLNAGSIMRLVMDPDFPVRIANGRYATCALLTTGKIKCWGQGAATGSGVSTTVGCDSLNTLASLAFSDTIPAIAIGPFGITACALFANGRVRCWGDNQSMQLGIPSNVASIGDRKSVV